MRKIAFAAAMAGSALVLTGCSDVSDDTATSAAEDVAGSVDAAEDVMQDTADSGAIVDANTATAEQLAGTEGVLPELAEAIVSGQPYDNVTALNATLLETLSQEEAAAVLVNVFVPVNLNDASSEEIALIPGMTDRMIHEFEEYRPYADMNQFNREIGKYVDEEEVARFRNYVTL